MRHLITGLVAAVAVMAAAPAMACGYSSCGYAAPVYVAPPVVAYTSSGCNPCGGVGWGYERERLADPIEQYYYVNQGPTYSGPGAWAPAPVYREATVSGYSAYSRPYRYGYSSGYGYRARVHHHHHHHPRMGYHHGYAPRHAHAPRYAPHRGHHAPLRRYF